MQVKTRYIHFYFSIPASTPDCFVSDFRKQVMQKKFERKFECSNVLATNRSSFFTYRPDIFTEKLLVRFTVRICPFFILIAVTYVCFDPRFRFLDHFIPMKAQMKTKPLSSQSSELFSRSKRRSQSVKKSWTDTFLSDSESAIFEWGASVKTSPEKSSKTSKKQPRNTRKRWSHTREPFRKLTKRSLPHWRVRISGNFMTKKCASEARFTALRGYESGAHYRAKGR